MELILQIAIGACFFGFIIYLVVCTLAGLRPTDQRLISYQADQALAPRQFQQPVPQVHRAFVQGIAKSSGMKLVDQRPEQLLVDCKPTPRIMGGVFGTLLRVRFMGSEAGTAVLVESSKKVSFATSIHPQHALRELERTLRMAAKQAGAQECVHQPSASNTNQRVPHVFG